MNWWGAIVGALLGWAVGRSWGALLGAFLGYSLAANRGRMNWAHAHAGRAQAVFFNTTFLVMGCIAKADGRVSEDEIRAARAIMAQMNLSAEQQRAAIELFNQGKQPDFQLDPALIHFRDECGGYPALLRMFLQIQLAAAFADGVLQPAEQAIFARICALLGIPPIELRQYEEFIRAQQTFGGGRGPARAQPDKLAAAYQTLGMQPADSDEEIKRAYRRLMKENHPDRLVSRGLPAAMLKIAQEKAQQINIAYDAIKNARNMK
ncbi:MAG TPA: co-chaperone DjlA [Gammaproteobacteria bacterium]|nr:co-chaperone DjlA [Gammaproteobacteria bacterium]